MSLAKSDAADAAGAGQGAGVEPGAVWPELPLFPLQTVLFPGGLLHLRVFEARYLDLISHCLRTASGFGVVCLNQGSEVRGAAGGGETRLVEVAVLAHLGEVDAAQPGILNLCCLGGQRLKLASPKQRSDGLWLAEAQALPYDAPAAVPSALAGAAQALAATIANLAAQDQHPFAQPYQFDDAGWVANRWCEILPIPLSARYRLMVLDEPVLRLKLVDGLLRGKKLI